MLRRIDTPSCNVDTGVEFILRGARKRRSMAMANAQMMQKNAEMPQTMVMVK